MSKFTDHLWRDLVNEHGPTLAQTNRPDPGRAGERLLRRPRILAGSTLGLAGIGATLALVLGGTAATTPAFAVTRSNDGSVLVHLNYVKDLNLPQLNAKLHSMGLHEGVTIWMASGAASESGAVTCAQGAGAATPVRVLVGANGTETIAAGQSAGNTAEGNFHLDRCLVTGDNAAGNSGNTGAG